MIASGTRTISSPSSLLAVLAGDKNEVVPIFQLGALTEDSARDHVRQIHRLDIVIQLEAALVLDGFGVHQVKMIERHLVLHWTA